MTKHSNILRGTLVAAFAVTGLTTIADQADAGGFAVREQSASYQGSSFAGVAAGDDISSMYWNPAGVTVVDGINTYASNSLILGSSEITATDYTVFGVSQGASPSPPPALHPNPFNAGTSSGNIARPALVGASYANMQLNNIYVGMSINAPFGLVTAPSNRDYAGSLIGRTSRVFNLVGTPTVGIKVSPGIAIAAGAQIAYMDATFKFGPAAPGFNRNLGFRGDDYGFGYTLGVMLEPAAGTKIGLGFRSMVEYELNGKFFDNVIGTRFSALTTLQTPEIITLSVNQAVSDNMRVLGTFEWTNWSRFGELPIIARQGGIPTALAGAPNTLPTGGVSATGLTFATLDANWDDAWFASIGVEYDLVPEMTLRAGVAYEESPIQNPTQRLTAVPDTDRIWLSGGLTWAITPTFTVDASYTHIFMDDAKIERASIANSNVVFFANAEQSVDIISIGFRTKFGAHEEVVEPLK